MKTLVVNSENFSVIRETLKSGKCCKVNDLVVLESYLSNTEKVNESGKVTRTPFLYIAKDGTKYTSTQLKKVLGIECEVKGPRKVTTFAAVWQQIKGLAATASEAEIKNAFDFFKSEHQAREEERLRREKETEDKERALLATLLAKYGK